MNTALSTLGIVHTIISVLALIFAAVALIQTGRIDLRTTTGKYYLVSTILACLTSFGLSRAGGFNPGHALAILILLLFAVVYLAMNTRILGRFSTHAEVFCMTFTLFISLIPGINETLTHLPANNPIAANIDAPIIRNSILVAFVLFLVGVILQLRNIKAPVARAKEAIH